MPRPEEAAETLIQICTALEEAAKECREMGEIARRPAPADPVLADTQRAAFASAYETLTEILRMCSRTIGQSAATLVSAQIGCVHCGSREHPSAHCWAKDPVRPKAG